MVEAFQIGGIMDSIANIAYMSNHMVQVNTDCSVEPSSHTWLTQNVGP